jgi:hypothetical protein
MGPSGVMAWFDTFPAASSFLVFGPFLRMVGRDLR